MDIVYLCPICLQDDDLRSEFWSNRQNSFGNPRNPYRIKDYYAIDPEYGTDADLRRFVAEAHRLGLRVLLDLVYPHCGPAPVFLEEHPGFVRRTPEGEMECTSFHFPILNFDNAELRRYLWDNMEYWIREFDVDGYRCDTSDMVPLEFWTEGRSRMEALKPGSLLLAESHRADDTLRAFDLTYCFPWTFGLHATARKSPT